MWNDEPTLYRWFAGAMLFAMGPALVGLGAAGVGGTRILDLVCVLAGALSLSIGLILISKNKRLPHSNDL